MSDLNTSDFNKALVRRFLDEVYNNARPAVIDEVFADDYVDHTASTEQAPGPAGARQIYDVFHTAFPDLRVDVHDMVADGDLVTVRSTLSGTSRGPLMGAEPTGKRVEIASMVFLRVRDGRFVERWEQMDLLGLMLQLGIVAESESESAGGDT
ncbi:MAG TPA: ester cyclase [Acidobacteria bacterium]|nr:ester cyclase [Acidobacteriota bacterium]